MTGLDVALVAQYVRPRDGQGQVMLELGRALRRAGHSVTVYAHEVADLECRFVAIPRFGPSDAADNVAFFLSATRRVRAGRHDVAVVMGGCALPAGPWLYYAQFSQRGWRRTWTGDGRPGLYHRSAARVAEGFERLGAARADALVGCSAQVVADVAPAGAAFVVPNGVDLHVFAPPSGEEQKAARSAFGLGDDTPVIGLLGEYRTPRKGLEPLLESMAAATTVEEHLLLAGDGDQDNVRQLVGRAGLAARVHQLGFADSRQVIAACDAVVVPSFYEPFSIAAVEAAAMARPVVISAQAGAAAYLGEGALQVAHPEPALLRRTMDQLWAEGAGARRRRGEEARRSVEALSWEATSAQVVSVVEDLARPAAPLGS